MRILYLGNNWLGWQVLQWLRQQGEGIAGLVVHPPNKRKFGEEILEAANLPTERVFGGSELRDPDALQAIRALQPDIGISIMFGYILRAEFLEIFPEGCINLHPAYLPYNRGAYPNVWSIIEGTPAGITLHYIDTGIDTGSIIAQRQVLMEPVDTGETLYRKLEIASLELFKDTWPLVKTQRIEGLKQSAEGGTCHSARDVERIDEIQLDKLYTARELIDVLRARTFPPYHGAYVMVNGRKVYLRLQLIYDEMIREDRSDEHDD